MAVLRYSAPLSWPSWMPVTPRASQRTDKNFAPPMALEESIKFLDQEIQSLGCNAVLSLDIDQPLIERLRKKVGSRTGVALQMKFIHGTYVIACDSWTLVEHNIYALHLALRQWRNMERWGVAPLPVLLHGFSAAAKAHEQEHAQPVEITDWMGELGLGPTATLDDAQAIYHRRAKQYAQDTEALTRLNIMMEDVRAHFSRKN